MTNETQQPDSQQRVGWIGTGRMGKAMSTRLARAGVALAVWNRTRSKAEPIADEGAEVVDKIRDLADRDVVFTMVSTPADLEEVLLGADNGLLTGDVRPGIVVDTSTVSTESSAKIRQACHDLGVEFVASPVSGNGKVVEQGMLTLVASGDRASFDKVEPLLEIIGRSVTYVGETDESRLVKIAHNVMLGVVTQCMAEVTTLVEKGGVSRHDFLEFLNDSVMGSPFTRYKTPAFVNLDYTPTFTPVLLRKDFDLGLTAAKQLGVSMPQAATTAELVQASIGSGRVDEDFAILLDMQAAASGMTLVSEDVEVDDGLSGEPA